MSSNLKIRYNFSRKKKPFKAERKAQRKERVSKFAGGEKLSVLRRRLKGALPKKGWRGGQGRRAEGPRFLQRNLQFPSLSLSQWEPQKVLNRRMSSSHLESGSL